MKNYVKAFFVRGMMFAWGGPIVLAIVWLCLKQAGVMSTLTVKEGALGIISTAVMAFAVAGISIVYQIEKLPKIIAGLIQFAVIYFNYLGVYLLNGWLALNDIWIFTLIFAVVFAIIWLSVYISIRIKVNKVNDAISK